MLDQQDIKQIGNIVEEKIDQRVGVIVEDKVNAMGRGLEQRLETKIGQVIEEKVNAMGKGLEQHLETKIGQVVEEKIDKAITEKIIPQIAEMIDQNILPQFEGINSRLDKVESRLSKVERDMVTKDYLDDKLADLKGDLVGIDRKQDKKVNFLVESLDTNEILPDSDTKLLRQMEVFPSPPRLN